jgi:hypothetical protein
VRRRRPLGGSHWAVDEEGGAGGLVNVNAKSAYAGFLRESPGSNCTAGNSAQLGIAGGKKSHGGEAGISTENGSSGSKSTA